MLCLYVFVVVVDLRFVVPASAVVGLATFAAVVTP